MKRTTTAIIALVGILLASLYYVGKRQQEPSENTIVPGVCVGDYTFGMNKDDVLKKLGEPEAIQLIGEGVVVHRGEEKYSLNNLPRQYAMAFGDISFRIDGDAVKEIGVHSPLYKFANGLRVGDSENKIKQAFGNDFQLEEFEGIDVLTYKEEGLRFEIHKKNQTIAEILVYEGSSVKPIESIKPFDDVRSKDLSKLDLSSRKGLIATLKFNQETFWPEQAKMPPGCDPNKILTDGMNPGLGVRELHQRGITGKGVNVAIIDQPLFPDHPEYDGKIVAYHDTGCDTDESSYHGPAVASLLVGTHCGTAPDARLYYAAAPSWKGDTAYEAKALNWIIKQNKKLPASEKIRVVSVSAAPSSPNVRDKNQHMWDRACARAKADGIMVLDCTDSHRGFINRGWYHPGDPESVIEFNLGPPPKREFRVDPTEMSLYVPSSCRTVAQHYDYHGRNSYIYCGRGGLSWSIPYCAGVLAMGWQIRPDLTPAQMKEMLFASAHVQKSGAKIINPGAFIDLVRKHSRDQQHIRTRPQTNSETQTIVPGLRAGDYTFDMSKDEVLKKLGEPKVINYSGEHFRLNDLPTRYFIHFGDISFYIVDDSVNSIIVYSPLYKFANGLGVGDSEEKIKQAFGDDFRLRETLWKDILTYEDEGLTFEIRKKNRTVMEISVYQTTKDHGDSDTPDSRKVIMLSEQPPGPITFPKIDRKPKPGRWGRGEMKSLPKYDPDSDNSFQVDLRGYDLSKLDLRNSIENLMYAAFDDRTVWPAPNQMPSDFNWQKFMELGKNPGLGIRSLHKKGITGRGVRVAIIDQPLLVDHQEYVERVRLYEEIDLQGETDPSMHGAAVASIAVGKTVGVAPEAELYYIAQYFVNRAKGTSSLRSLAQGIHRMLEINEQLPKHNKIRVISMSIGWMPSHKDYKVITEAVQKARAAGMLVVCSGVQSVHEGCGFGGLGRSPLADPEAFESYEPGLYLAKIFRARRIFLAKCHFWVPMDSRTTASPTGSDEYVFYSIGGVSWAIPYIAGVYALAVQVDPAITPESFWALAVQTGRTIELNYNGKTMPLGPIIDPVRLIRSIKAGELSNKEIFD